MEFVSLLIFSSTVSRSSWKLEMLVFVEEVKLEYLAKKPTQQG